MHHRIPRSRRRTPARALAVLQAARLLATTLVLWLAAAASNGGSWPWS
jgi:hypothetical protein